MKFNIFMLGFMNGEIRTVNVPDEECKGDTSETLERIFYWGQNDFQSIADRCSVSVGDIVDYFGKYYLIKITGWKEISFEELQQRKEKALNNPSSSNALDFNFDFDNTNNKEKITMGNFNLKNYLKKIFSVKKKDNKQGEQIETKLNEQNKNGKESQEIIEGLLKKDRKDTEENIIEKKLEKVRINSQEMLIEGQLNKNKNSLIKHRNVETAKGDINKLEEKRLKGDVMESEKQEPASEVDKPRRFWENKSPDGLKLAQNIKIAKISDYNINFDKNEDYEDAQGDYDFDIDWDDENQKINLQTLPSFEEKLSPEVLEELKNFEIPKDNDESIKEKRTRIKDIISDPDMLNDVFSEEVLAIDESSGTKIKERQINFDLRDVDGEIKEIFKNKEDEVDENILKKAILNFIRFNHLGDHVDINSLDLNVDETNLTGFAIYMVSV